MVTQQQIDNAGYCGQEVISVDPVGGGVDVLYRVGILDVITSTPYSRRLVQWKRSDDIPDVIPGEGQNSDIHFIGVAHGENERFVFVECSEAGDYTLEIPSFSEVSDEIIVRRAFCAALRPTTSEFTFTNPIANVTVPASPDTVTLQTVALSEVKIIKSTDTITVTHAQDFPCVFGIVYKHKAKGEVVDSGSSPEPTATVLRQSFSFQAPNEKNYLEHTFDAGGNFSSVGGFAVRVGGVNIQKITLQTIETGKQCYRLRFTEFNRLRETITHDIVTDDNFLVIGDNTELATLVASADVSRLAGIVNIEMTVPECEHDIVLTIDYTLHS